MISMSFYAPSVSRSLSRLSISLSASRSTSFFHGLIDKFDFFSFCHLRVSWAQFVTAHDFIPFCPIKIGFVGLAKLQGLHRQIHTFSLDETMQCSEQRV